VSRLSLFLYCGYRMRVKGARRLDKGEISLWQLLTGGKKDLVSEHVEIDSAIIILLGV
jgi:hypothetical protein